MQVALRAIHRFLTAESGPTAVEYAILLALGVVVGLTTIRTFGTTTHQSLSNSMNSIAS